MPVSIGIKNLTGAEVAITDLGLFIAASSTADLTGSLSPDRLRFSSDLQTAVQNDQVVITENSLIKSKAESLVFISGGQLSAENITVIAGSNMTVSSGTNFVSYNLSPTITGLTSVFAVTVTGTSASFAGSFSGQSASFSSGLTVSGVSVSAGVDKTFQIFADSMSTPLSSWPITSISPLVYPTSTGSIQMPVRSYDDTTEEGAGWSLKIPSGSSAIDFQIISSPATAPAGSRFAGLKLYQLQLKTFNQSSTWNSGNNLTDVTIRTDLQPVNTTVTKTLSSLNLIAGEAYMFELTRINPIGGGTELTGDLYIYYVEMRFT